MSRPSKKPKPTFEVARDPIPETRSGWVFRSDGPSPAPAAPPPRPIVAMTEVAPDRFEPQAAQPQVRSWIATGVYLMFLPVTLGASIMFAPINWMMGSRSRR